jgi:predicted ATPase/class 3 adenylate cyclase
MRNLIPHFIQEEYTKENFEGNFEALTMFVDVSGFTPMTQALMTWGHEGAEILATIMNGIFDVLVSTVYERGGFVSTFAGDAFTAIFPFRDDVIPDDELVFHVFACVGKIQSIFHRHGIQTTPYGQFALHFKVGLSRGTVNWGIVGKTEKAFFFRGEAIDGCAIAEHQADKGDVMFDEQVAQAIRKAAHLVESPWNISQRQGGYYHLHEIPKAVAQLNRPKLPRSPRLNKQVVSQFFPEILVDFSEIGEFRRVVSMFISFEGISTLSALDDWAVVLLENLNTFGGYFHRMNFGDKGGFVLCGFGAPVTYENIIDRALNFILAVREALPGFQNLAGLRFRAGITYGTAYAGIAGGEKRCEYTYHGEVVNLAARFMMKADWGEIFVSDAVRDKTVQFNFAHKGDFLYKGIADPVSTWMVINRKTGIRHQPFTEAMIGRHEELKRLQQFAAPIFNHTFAGILSIYGEAGIGKSRLAYALQEAFMQQHTITWFNCPADHVVYRPFNPFITCFMRYFEQASEHPEEENKARFEEKYDGLIEALRPGINARPESSSSLEATKSDLTQSASASLILEPGALAPGDPILHELIRTKSVIGAQLGLFWKDSLWEQLDAKGKYDNTVSAIKNFFLAHSLLRPVVIELEDGHWFGGDSLVVLQALTRNVTQYPLLMLSTLRYSEYGSKPCLLNPQDLTERNIPYEEIELREFSDTDLRNFAESHLDGQIDEQFFAVLTERTNGNPFFAEQLLHYFMENELVEYKDERWQFNARDSQLPDTINAVLMARIDRLTEEVKEVVKAAAVIGREFEVVLLSAILKGDVLSQVQIIRKARIWEEVQELRYMFKHALLRDIAYGMQLKSRLRELHQLTAETMETLYATSLAKHYVDLAFHYERAEIRDKAIEYLEKGGDEAKAQYQHHQALELYDRLLNQLQSVLSFPEKEIDTLLKKGEILELIGEWKACHQVYEEALRLSEQINDTCRIGKVKQTLGVIWGRKGEYDKAMTYLDQALKRFEAVNERRWIGNVLTNKGFFHWQKSNYDAAMVCYAKALTIAEELEDTLVMAKNANHIGIIYDMQGNYEVAMTWYRKSLQICEELGEKLERSRILNNMGECYRENRGDYKAAMTYYQQALTIAEELGDKLSMVPMLGNVGHVYLAQGEYERAIASYDRAIAIARELESRYYLCEYLLGKAEVLFSLQRYAEAQVLAAEGLRIVEEIGRKECIFQGNLLSAKIDFALGNEDAPHRLADMLQQIQDDVERALLHYELWKMTHHENHRQTALKYYQTLYETTPNSDYKKRVEEMQGSA